MSSSSNNNKTSTKNNNTKTVVSKTPWRRLALEGTRVYQSTLNPSVSHNDNVKDVLRGIVLGLTFKAQGHELQNAGEQPTYEWKEETLELLDRTSRARLQGFLQSISLAVPSNDPIIRTRRQKSTPKESSNQKSPTTTTTPELSFDSNDASTGESIGTGSSPLLSSIQDAVRSTSRTLRGRGKTSNAPTTMVVQFKSYPQIRSSILAMRLELYFQNCAAASASSSSRQVNILASCLVRSFCATVDSCVASVAPILMGLLQALTMEVLCVEEKGLQYGTLQTMMKRIISEYEHKVSFASLAFLSSPQDSAEQVLLPLVMKYVSFLHSPRRSELQEACNAEIWLSQVLPRKLRHVFHTVEFQSPNHLLEVCRSFQYELSHVDIMPNDDAAAAADDDGSKTKQALLDLQREVLSVNGQTLPPITSREQLVQLLTSTLNQTVTQQFVLRDDDDDDETSKNISSSTLDTQTLDALTRRLLLATSRTGSAGDAYFVVRDLFGGEDVEIVPSSSQSNTTTQQQQQEQYSIELKACLSSVTIICYSCFLVFPKDMADANNVEPLMELHTTTTERIYLQEVRSDGTQQQLVLQEKLKYPRKGYKTLSIRPAYNNHAEN